MNNYTTNGCYFTPLKVLPKNWQKRTSIRKGEKWMIYYRFYDPLTRNNKNLWGKLIRIKGMNIADDAKERILITRHLIHKETEMLQRSWNPIFAKFMVATPEEKQDRFSLKDALWWAYDKMQSGKQTMTDVKSVVSKFIQAATNLYDRSSFRSYDQIPVKKITKSQVRAILDECERVNPRFSNNRYNVYKAYISSLFTILCDDDIIEHNIIKGIKKKPVIKKIRRILTIEEEQLMNDHLYQKDYYFWRFMQIFYYADARETELMKIRKDGTVNIDQQEFVVEIIKGKHRREELKQISNEVVDLWKEILEEAKPGDYLFSKGLKPGPKKIRPDQIGRRWKRLVKAPLKKGGLDINKDFRSLNHSHLTKVSTKLGIKAAQHSRGHTTPVITMNIYDVTFKQRMLDDVKDCDIEIGEKAL